MLEKNEMITKGAEAVIFHGSFLQTPIIMKQRFPKTYRLPQIDKKIRRQRLRAEARIMTLAWKNQINVPALLGVDIFNQILFIEKIHGDLLFSLLDSISFIDLKQIFKNLGFQIALLHENDIIHGDLTVFNVVVERSKNPCVIDFGLGFISIEVEKKADDLLTFFNTLKAITPKFQELFDDFKRGYLQKSGEGRKTFEHMKKIQSRARYIAREDRIE
ncbi:MAG: KEOPS complex kinase/ATPase Bud32 [Candidatus Hodarchaeales archaeon]